MTPHSSPVGACLQANTLFRRRLSPASRLLQVLTARTWRSVLMVIFSLGYASVASAADVDFVRVWPSWRDSDYFDRIGHFFGWPGSLAPGSEVMVRTEAAVHNGYYFLVRLKSPTAIGAAKFEVSVIRPDTLRPVTTEFAV